MKQESDPSTPRRRIKTEHEPIPCTFAPECDRVFQDHAKLKRHLLVHTGEKNFFCPICNKPFSLEYNMKIHQRIHSGEKPYECSFPGCWKRFAQAPNMNMHMKNHENAWYNHRMLQRRAMMEGRDNDSESMVFSMEVTPKKFQEFQIIRFPENMRITRFDTLGAMMRLRKSFLSVYNPKNIDDYFQLQRYIRN